MAYRVRLAVPAEADAYAAYEAIREIAPASAERWLRRLIESVLSLQEMPSRCPVISEAEELGREIRHLLFGKGTGMFRILFDIVEDEQGSAVRVLRIWRAAQDRVRPEDLEA